MLKSILPATVLSLMLGSAALALPGMIESDAGNSNLVLAGYKGHHGYKNYNKHYYKKNYNYSYNKRGRYHYGNRYWGHRYYARPYNWQTLGCLAVGPVWYCP